MRSETLWNTDASDNGHTIPVCAREPNHLAPLVDFLDYELSEICNRHRHQFETQISKTRF
jgi:hypothetical protein